MARWEPNARERLVQAALELYRERGYDETAVADIAERAGLTERTFFRHFADKREVLFGGSELLQNLLVDQIANTPPSVGPMDSIAAALDAVSSFFEDRRPQSKARQAVITANAALRERELIKLASLAAAMAGALRKRGVREPAASLAAETGIAIFKLAFEQWLEDEKKRDFAHHVCEVRDELKILTAHEKERPIKSARRRMGRR